MWLLAVIVASVLLITYSGYRERSHEQRYEYQTELRRGIIRKLYKEPMSDKDWEHMTLVLRYCGCRDSKNEKLGIEKIKNEHAEMVLSDLKIEVEIKSKS